MEDMRRHILEEVRLGTITPAEALGRLELLDPAPEPDRPAHAATATATATRIKVLSVMDQAIIVGDDSVAEAVAEGPHRVRREGDTLVFEAEGPLVEGYRHERRLRLNVMAAFGGNREAMRVRVNPDLPLEVETQAGVVRIEGVRSAIRAQAQAGSMRITGFRGPLDVTVQAGNLVASGVLSTGASRVRCEAGSVKLALGATSSVKVSAAATVGRVQLGDQASSPSNFGLEDRQELTIGSGTATLEIEATMGSVQVSVGS